MEATKNICWVKGEEAVHDSTVTRWFKKFCSHCKNLDNQVRWGRLNIGFQSSVPSHRDKFREYQVILASHSSVVSHHHNLRFAKLSQNHYQNITKLLSHPRNIERFNIANICSSFNGMIGRPLNKDVCFLEPNLNEFCAIWKRFYELKLQDTWGPRILRINFDFVVSSLILSY